MRQTLSKQELKRVMKNFIADHDRGISMNLFSEIAGISAGHLYEVFVQESHPLTEIVQRRTSKAYFAWISGEVAVMQNRDTSKFVQYRKEAKPLFRKSLGLQATPDGIKINLGIKPKYDYSGYSLDEQLKRG